MIILGFDTSNAYSSVSISNGDELLYAKKDKIPNSQAEKLVLLIEEALQETNLTYGNVKYLAVSCGPGSFTGIRIALATARGILLAAPAIKPIAVNNFQMINYRIRQQFIGFDHAVTAVNAHRDELYLQIFNRKNEQTEAVLVSLEEAKKIVQGLNGVKALGGSGWEQVFDIESSNEYKEIVILPRFAYPDARFACKLAHIQIVQHKENPNIEALYIRPPDAKLPLKL